MRKKIFLVVILMLALLLVRHEAWANTYTVTNLNDSGPGSLRQAIIDANNNPGPDTISFNISGCGGVCTIEPSSPLPSLTDDGTTIDGYTQPGATEATGVTPAILLIEINGADAANSDGFRITSAGNVIRGLVINQFSETGIHLSGSSATANTISGNYIGTDASGTVDLGNIYYGVNVGDSAHDNTIGGDTAGERNVISGNDRIGVLVIGSGTSDNIVSGNYIGADASGVDGPGNQWHGVYIGTGAQNNTVGGGTAGERNIISVNGLIGVIIFGSDATGNTVSGNYIGTDASGTAFLGQRWDGVYIGWGAQNNTVGGDTAGERNVISGNRHCGIQISGSGAMSNTVSGNLIGLDASGTTGLQNWSSGVYIGRGAQHNSVGPGNIIAYNTRHGVEVDGDSTTDNAVTQNSIFFNDLGIYLTSDANGSIAAPAIDTITLGSVNVVGTACTGCAVEIFENSNTDGEGETYVGSTTTDTGGTFTVTVGSLNNSYLTATATNAISGTSEFSTVFNTVTLSPMGWAYLPYIGKETMPSTPTPVPRICSVPTPNHELGEYHHLTGMGYAHLPAYPGGVLLAVEETAAWPLYPESIPDGKVFIIDPHTFEFLAEFPNHQTTSPIGVTYDSRRNRVVTNGPFGGPRDRPWVDPATRHFTHLERKSPTPPLID